MKFFITNTTEIHPEDISELQLLAKKWKISVNDLSRAIVETGTTNYKKLKAHIRSSGPKRSLF